MNNEHATTLAPYISDLIENAIVSGEIFKYLKQDEIPMTFDELMDAIKEATCLSADLIYIGNRK